MIIKTKFNINDDIVTAINEEIRFGIIKNVIFDEEIFYDIILYEHDTKSKLLENNPLLKVSEKKVFEDVIEFLKYY